MKDKRYCVKIQWDNGHWDVMRVSKFFFRSKYWKELERIGTYLDFGWQDFDKEALRSKKGVRHFYVSK